MQETPAVPAARGRGLIVWGAVLLVAGVVVGIASVVLLVTGVVGGLADALTGPTYPTPARITVEAQQGTYVVYELTGARGGEGPFTVTEGGPVTITADQVRVTAPDGSTVPVGDTSFDQTITRGSQVYTGAVSFDVGADGRYVVEVATPDTRVTVAPSLGSALTRSGGWLLGIPLGALLLVAGLVLLVVGLVQRSRSRRAALAGTAPGGDPYGVTYAAYPPSQPQPYQPQPYQPQPQPYQPQPQQYAPQPALPPPGWYPDPDDPSRARWWDGQTWGPSST